MKYIKIILIAVLGVILPFTVLMVNIEYEVLFELSDTVLYLNPLYLPIFCGFVGVMIYKETGKILLPTLIFNLFLIFCTNCLTEMIFDAIERSLADALIGILLLGPLIYSVPISFIAPAIYKRKKEKAEVQKNNEDETTNETQI